MNAELEEYISKQKEIVISSYEHGKSYSNIIIFGGYAGLFTIWGFTKDNIEKWQSLTVGILAIISIVIFVIFELASAWLRGSQVKKLMAQLEEAEKMDHFPEEYGKKEREHSAKFLIVWPYFFFGSVLTGIGAGIILLYSFIINLVNV